MKFGKKYIYLFIDRSLVYNIKTKKLLFIKRA